MFKKEKSTNQENSKNKESLDRYIHTMQDDFGPTQKDESLLEQNNDKNEKISPFLPNNENIKRTSIDKKNIPSTPVNSSIKENNNSQQNNSESNPVQINNKKGIFRKIITIVIFLLVLSLIGLAAYYYFYLNKSDQIESLISPSSEKKLEDDSSITITPSLEKYSLEQPNFLSINVESSAPEEIKNSILKTAEEIQEDSTKTIVPFEFIITDKNNIPYAFPIFALASELNFSEQLLNSLEEKFSFYIYNDTNNIRVGLLVEIENKEILLSELKKQEETLVKDLSFLFLGNKPQKQDTQFKSGFLSGIETRFTNLNNEESLSIDYAVINKKGKDFLLIGTSKKSMSAMINKIKDQSQNNTNTDNK